MGQFTDMAPTAIASYVAIRVETRSKVFTQIFTDPENDLDCLIFALVYSYS